MRETGRALAAAVAIVAATLPIPARVWGASLTLILRDGAAQGRLRGFGRSLESSVVRDADAASDGICTFEFQPGCVRCALGRGCPSPDAAAQACSGPTFGRICSPLADRYAVPLGEARQVVRRRRFGRLRVIMRCRAAEGASTTTTTIPSATPDLHGHWTLTDDAVSDDCPAPIGAVLAQLSSPHPVELFQEGDTLRTCVDGIETFRQEPVAISSTGFTFDSPRCCEAIRDGYDYDFGVRLTGAASSPDGTVPTVLEYQLTRARGLPGPSMCTRTLTGTLRRIAAACGRSEDCLAADPCGRCVAGTCRPVCTPGTLH